MKNKAFTLVELLVVIAVIGLLASIVIVNLIGARSKANIARGLQFSQSVHHTLGAYAVGVWSFDEGSGTTANDSSGYGNNGTLVNGPVWRCASTDPSYTPSDQGCSIQFDGVDDYIGGINFDGIVTNELSQVYWIKKDNLSGVHRLTDAAPFKSGFTGDTFFAHTTSSSGTDNNTPYSSIGLTAKSWHLLVITRDTHNENNVKVYLDGVLKITGNLINAANGTMTLNYFNIGHSANSFDGLIDDVRIYEKVLETAQIEALYYAGLDSLLAKGLINKEEYQERLVLR